MKNNNFGSLSLIIILYCLFTNVISAQDKFVLKERTDVSDPNRDWSDPGNWTITRGKGKKAGTDTYPGETRTIDFVELKNGKCNIKKKEDGSINKIVIASLKMKDNSRLAIRVGVELEILSTEREGLKMEPTEDTYAELINRGTLTISGASKTDIEIKGKLGSEITITNDGAINIISIGKTNPILAKVDNKSGLQTVEINNNSSWTIAAETGNVNLLDDGVFNNDGLLTLNCEIQCVTGTSSTYFNNLASGILTFTGSNSSIALASSVIFNNEGGTLNTNTGSTIGVNLESQNEFTVGVTTTGDLEPGVISPGGDNGAGVVNISIASALIAPDGILRIQVLDEIIAGDDYDQMNVFTSFDTEFDIKNVTLDITNIYTPSVSTSIDILTIDGLSTITNTFADVIGLTEGWYVNYDGTNGKVQLVFASLWTGAVDSDWNNSGNWFAEIPDATSIIFIPDATNDPIISTDVSVNKLNIFSGAVFTVSEGAMLTNTNTITNNGTILLKSSVLGTGYLLSDSPIANVTQEQYLTSNQRGWRMLSNPLSTITFGTLASNSTTPITLGTNATGEYNSATDSWTNYGDADNMVSQKAYKVFIRGRADEVDGLNYSVIPPSNVTLAITGIALNTAPPVTSTTAGEYYLIANPYTAPVSVGNILAASTGLSNTVSYYNPTIGSDGDADLLVKKGGYDYIIVSGLAGSNTDVVLPVMGAIFVLATADGSLVIPKSAIYTGSVSGGDYANKTTKSKAVMEPKKLTINVLSNDVHYDKLQLYFKGEGEEGHNIDFGKLYNTELDFYSLNENNKEMAISELSLETQTIPLGIWSAKSKNFSFKVVENSIPVEFEAVLEDKLLNSKTVLTEALTYNFDLELNAVSDNRFSIVLKPSGSLSVEDKELKANIQVWPNPAKNQFFILNDKNEGDTTVEVYSVLGKLLYSETIASNLIISVDVTRWKSGVYFIRAMNNGSLTTKKIIKQ